jgi:hypothetical protein
LRAASGLVVVFLACAVYAWSVIGAFAQPTAAGSAFGTAYEYQYSNGHAKGGGTILRKSVTFAFTVDADANGLKGNCNVKDGKATLIDCLTITSLVVVGTHGTFSGTAKQNGTITTFTIDVDDLGEPAAALDRFAIKTGLGYSRSGVLSSGDIQVHER